MQAQAGSIIADMRMSMDNFRAGIKEAKGELNGLKNAGADFGKGMTEVGKNMTKYVTAPVIGLGTMAVKTAGDFEASMNKVKAITGATGEQFDALRNQALEMGRTTQYTASESAEALSFLGMAGFDATEAVEALPGVLQLAAAGNMDLATTADYASNILTGYGLEVKELGRVNDVLAKTFTSSNTNMGQLAEAMKYVGPVASGMGITIEETAAAVGMLGDAGIQGSMAGTTLRQALIQLMTPGGRAAEVIERLGLQTKNAEGEFVGFVSIVEQLEESGASTADMMELFGVRGAGMIAMVDQGSDKFKEFITDLENAGGTAEKIAEVQMEGLNGQFKKLKSALEGLLIAIGDQLLPIVTDFLLKATEWIQGLAEMDSETLKFYMTIAGAAAVIGPFLMLGGKVITMLSQWKMGMFVLKGGLTALSGPAAAASTAASGMATSTGAAAAAAGGMGTKLAALAAAGGPILAVGAALGIAAVYVNEYVKAMKFDFRTLEEEAKDSFDGLLETAENNAMALMRSQAESNLEMINAQLEYYAELENLTEEELAEVERLVDEAGKERRKIEQANQAEMLLAEQKFIEEVKDLKGKSNDDIIALAEERHAKLVEELDNETLDILNEIVQRHAEQDTLNSLAYQKEIDEVLDHYTEKKRVLNEQFGEELKIVEDALAERGLIYNEELGKIITMEEENHKQSQEHWTQRVIDMKESGRAVGRAAWQGTKEGLDEGEEEVEAAGHRSGRAVTRGTKQGIEDGTEEVEIASTNMMRRAGAAARREAEIDSPSKVFMRIGFSLMEGLREGILSMVDSVVSAVNWVIGEAKKSVANVKDLFKPIGENIPAGVEAGIRGSTDKATGASKDMAVKTTNAARMAFKEQSPSLVFKEIGENLVEGLVLGITDRIEDARNTTSDLMNGINAIAQSGLDTLNSMIQTALTTASSGAAELYAIVEQAKAAAGSVGGYSGGGYTDYSSGADYSSGSSGGGGGIPSNTQEAIDMGYIPPGQGFEGFNINDLADVFEIPGYHDGGIYRAPFGRSEGLALLEDGEVVISAKSNMSWLNNAIRSGVKEGLRENLRPVNENQGPSGPQVVEHTGTIRIVSEDKLGNIHEIVDVVVDELRREVRG